MKILVINCGSSSLKYQLIDMDGEVMLCRGLCDRIGIEGSSVKHEVDGKEWKMDADLPDHTAAFTKMMEMMSQGEGAVVSSKDEIDAIGHRVVQGAERFTKSEIVTDEVIDIIEEVAPLAPVHNMAHVQGLRSAKQVFGDAVPQVVVFDTTFHQTMPRKAYMYGLPYEYYEKYSIRRYGFHGTSHRFVSAKAAEYLGKSPQELKTITCHMGNGSSIAAVDGGKCVDTSMGLTPLAGIIMGTRCGDLDPSVVCYLNELLGVSGNAMSDILNKKSGFLGVSGVSSDNRDVVNAAEAGNDRAKLTQEMLAYQVQKYIGSYTASMNGLDCLVFTGGIGENADTVRAHICENMSYFGIEIDPVENLKRGEPVIDITKPGAKVKVLVIQTNEELMIARDTLALVQA